MTLTPQEQEADRVAGDLLKHASRIAEELGKPLTVEEAMATAERVVKNVPNPVFGALILNAVKALVEDLGREPQPPNRRELVEALLWMYAEHTCCADEAFVAVLRAEATVAGWSVPTALQPRSPA